MFSGKSLEKKNTGEKVIEEILSLISWPLLCNEVNSDWMNPQKAIPVSLSEASKL